ncbi:hypothetical protein FACS1894151_02320 [Spirochaetia bacterium]|nr:hypothetical protein FACS1894151_02320 [Spirochaetia bacterium]
MGIIAALMVISMVLLTVISMVSCGGGSSKSELDGTVWNGSFEDIKAKVAFFEDLAFVTASTGWGDYTQVGILSFNSSQKTGSLFDEDGDELVKLALNGSALLATIDGETGSLIKSTAKKSALEGIWSGTGDYKGAQLIFVGDSLYLYDSDENEAEAVVYTYDSGKKTGVVTVYDEDAVLAVNGNTLTISVGDEAIVFSKGAPAVDKGVADFLASYEKLVVSLENAAKSKKTADIIKVSAQASTLYAKSAAIIDDTSKWTSTQLRKLTTLSTRVAEAAAAAF